MNPNIPEGEDVENMSFTYGNMQNAFEAGFGSSTANWHGQTELTENDCTTDNNSEA